MTKLYLFLIVLFSAASLNANPSESTIRYGTSTYTFIKNKHYTWHQAKLKAEELGGHLAVLTSQEENDVVFKEHQYSVSNIPAFSAFALKVVLTGTNSSYPPLIRDMRGIALAV